MPNPTTSFLLRFSAIGLRLLFVITVIGLIRIDNLSSDYSSNMLYLEIAMGALQALHAWWVGYRLGSPWHKNYVKGISIYVLIAIGLIVFASMVQSLILIIILLLLLGLVIPTALGGFYAFAQTGFMQLDAPTTPSDPTILDDELP